MKRTAIAIVLASLLVGALPVFSFGQSTPPAHAGSPVVSLKGDFVPNRLLVKFKPHISPVARASLHAQAGAEVLHVIEPIDVQVLKIPEGQLETAYKLYASNPTVAEVSPDYIVGAAFSPDDPYFNDGTQYGPQKIEAPAAWDVSSGRGVIIAIVDSGVDPNHPDLQGRWVPGYNFVDYTTNTADDYGHGTFVAGIAAATANNSQGIAGVAFDSFIMPVKVLGSNGLGAASAIASGITYAVDHGARVINLSVGGSFDSFAERDAVNYAHNQGAVVVAAAGNNNSSDPLYPGSYPASFTVAGTDRNDVRYTYSNYGSQIDVAAPGVGIFSTFWRSDIGSTYASGSGTSFAAPHVAGLAALLFAQNPNYTVDEVESLIAQNADDLGDPGWDPYFGYGRVNARRALAASSASVPTPVPPTATPMPTATPVPPTATPMPTATPVPPTATPMPTATPVPPTVTPMPTATPVDPTATPMPTATPALPTATPMPTATPVDPPATLTSTPLPPPPEAASYTQWVNAGGDDYTDSQGHPCDADQRYDGSWGYTKGRARFSDHAVEGTIDDPLYQHFREDPHEYRFAVPNGDYEVTLLFAEFKAKKATERQMRIIIEDTVVEDALSIYREVGKNHALARVYYVTVADGELNIRFQKNGGKKKPVVSGIAVQRLESGAEPPIATPTPVGPPADSTMHVGDLDGSSTNVGRKWRSTVTVTIHDGNRTPVAGAVVTGHWSEESEDPVTCTTDGNGQCSVTSHKMHRRDGSVTFVVDDVAHTALVYRSLDNQDPDGDSDGTSITVYRP